MNIRIFAENKTQNDEKNMRDDDADNDGLASILTRKLPRIPATERNMGADARP